MFYDNPEIIKAIRTHAVLEYPNEACGIIAGGEYIPVENIADDPAHDFAIDPAVLLRQGVEAVVHSHPDGPAEPTATDIAAQVACDIPYGLCVSHEDSADAPFFWGDPVPVPDLIGREFRHGPSGSDNRGDCYALIRDYYREERGVVLPEFPRDNDWWNNGGDLYEEGFAQAGFRPLAADEEPQVGDVGLILMPRCKVVNHGCVYVGNGLILHHLYNRLSGREPAGRWGRHIVRWLRYEA